MKTECTCKSNYNRPIGTGPPAVFDRFDLAVSAKLNFSKSKPVTVRTISYLR